MRAATSREPPASAALSKSLGHRSWLTTEPSIGVYARPVGAVVAAARLLRGCCSHCIVAHVQVLGGIVFSDPAQLAKLNALVWPHIRKSVDAEVEKAVAQGAEAIVVEAAVLLEAGWDTSCDHVWIVTAPQDVAKARLMARNGLSEAEALKRIKSQSDHRPEGAVLINNDSGLAELAKQVKTLYGQHLCSVRGGVDEVVMQVDEDNNVIGDVPRSQVVRTCSTLRCVSLALTLECALLPC